MWTTSGGLRGRSLRVSITVTAVMGFSLFGYNQGMMAGLIDGDEFKNSFPILKIPSGASPGTEHYVNVIRGAVTACYEIGCFFGALFSMVFGEKIGRTRLVFAGAFRLPDRDRGRVHAISQA